MKIRYIGTARADVCGAGSFEPGDERTVDGTLGAELVRGGEFEEVVSAATAARRERKNRAEVMEVAAEAAESAGENG